MKVWVSEMLKHSLINLIKNLTLSEVGFFLDASLFHRFYNSRTENGKTMQNAQSCYIKIKS